MPRPTSRDPVKAMKRVFGCLTTASPKLAPAPGQKFTTPGGMPASSRNSINFAAMVGESLEGLRMTVLPQTAAAAVIPAIIAHGKFHGGITAPTPSGMYWSVSRSPGSCTGGSAVERRGRLGSVKFGKKNGKGAGWEKG